MSVISKINLANARIDPEAAFESPEQVVDHPGMTRAQKLTAIAAWRLAIERRLAATAEGMPPEGTADPDLAMLERVLKVEAELNHRPEPDDDEA